jgi:hypothetical protein
LEVAVIFELAGHGPDLIQVTAQYSNAVLVALLPYFSDAAHKLDLPVPQPITVQSIVDCGISPYRYPNGDIYQAGIEVRGGWALCFMGGRVNFAELRPSYFTVQNPDDLTNYYGKVRMSKDEAVQMARDAIKKMGVPLEWVFAEQEPRVTMPPKIHSHVLPYYRIEWLDPRVGSLSQSGSDSVDIGINADAKRVERINLQVNENLRRAPPKIDAPTPVRGRPRPHVNPEYARKLLPIVLRAVDAYGKILNLPIPRPLSTNQVARFEVGDNGGWPHSELELTNGWRFIYRNSMVNGYYTPDNLFGFSPSGRRMLIKDYTGKWNLTDTQAIALVRQTIAKLNFPTNLVHMDFKPKIQKPLLAGIPRYQIEWEFTPPKTSELEVDAYPQSWVEAEVDMDKGMLKSLYYDDITFWHHPPPIDVPISGK